MRDSPNCRDKSQRVYASKDLAGSEPELPKPEWLKIRLSPGRCFNETKSIVQEYNLPTVCEEANCPNLSECWQKKHATFMILGAICTRSCAFCDVITGKPGPLDDEEPLRLAQAVKAMGLRHVVITSVDRDDLPDGGAVHFAKCINAVRKINQNTTIEVLTPDFRNKNNALEVVVDAVPDVYNHNIETVPRLYGSIRPSARYFHSLNLLYRVKQLNCKIPTKSGIIVGMGESAAEIAQVLDDLRAAEVDFVTIGQYLRPSKNHWPVDRYVTPEEFASYKAIAIAKGFKMVASGPFVRSSYHAEEDFLSLRQKLIADQQN